MQAFKGGNNWHMEPFQKADLIEYTKHTWHRYCLKISKVKRIVVKDANGTKNEISAKTNQKIIYFHLYISFDN